jgi:hypothetical protein
MPNGQWPELGARGAAPGTAYYSRIAHRTPRTSARLRPTAGSRHENVHSLFTRFFGFTQPCTGVPSCQYRAEPARGAYAAPASDLLWLLNRRLYTGYGPDATRE